MTTEDQTQAEAQEAKTKAKVRDLVQLIRDNNIRVINHIGYDVSGAPRSIPISISSKLNDDQIADLITDKLSFDASSIGFNKTNASDAFLIPDPFSARVDTLTSGIPTLHISGNIHDIKQDRPHDLDPRTIAQKAHDYMVERGIGDKSYWGPEPEVFLWTPSQQTLIPHVNREIKGKESTEQLPILQRLMNPGNNPNVAPHQEHYMAPIHSNPYFPILLKVADAFEEAGLSIERITTEVAVWQYEVNHKFTDGIVQAGDDVGAHKSIFATIAQRYGLNADFSAKPVQGVNGSGMHVNQSVLKNGKSIFADQKVMKSYIAGLLKYTPQILAFGASHPNSYDRLSKKGGFETASSITWGESDRTAVVRVPVATKPERQRVEFRSSDGHSNPHLLFAAMLLAGIAGIEQKLDPDQVVKEMEEKKIGLPENVEQALAALKADNEFLRPAFSEAFIERYCEITAKRAKEYTASHNVKGNGESKDRLFLETMPKIIEEQQAIFDTLRAEEKVALDERAKEKAAPKPQLQQQQQQQQQSGGYVAKLASATGSPLPTEARRLG